MPQVNKKEGFVHDDTYMYERDLMPLLLSVVVGLYAYTGFGVRVFIVRSTMIIVVM